MTPAEAQALQDEAAAHGQWLVWLVTDADIEHPGEVVARAQRADHQGGTRLPDALVADTLDDLRTILPADLTRRDRTSALPPYVLETWNEGSRRLADTRLASRPERLHRTSIVVIRRRPKKAASEDAAKFREGTSCEAA